MASSSSLKLDALTQEKLLDLFDNEALWDADDTDAYMLQLFQELEAAGADLKTLQDQGWNSLLHTAALWNRPKIMEDLVRRGAALNDKNRNGHTPLDLAMHWGHFELGQQLQHYGAKHTCEKERDIAISQRDLAQQQQQDCEAELTHALRTLKQAKREREELRIERDRLVVLRARVVDECSALAAQIDSFRTAVVDLTTERDALQVRAAQVQDELRCEQTARNNAVHSWKVAEALIVELQQVQEECREREEEALRLRNEALQERDVAREAAKQAQLDQGLAKQNQREVERERDRAVQRLLAGESEIAHDMDKWRKRIAKTELERRNIQIEIDRQTELLRAENARLEKTVTTLTVANTRQREEVEKTQLAVLTLETQLRRQQLELKAAKDKTTKSDEQLRALLEERRQEYKAWRARLEAKMQQEYESDLKLMLGEAVATWRMLQTCQQQVAALDIPPDDASITPPTRSASSSAMSNIFQTQRPQTTISRSAESPVKPRVLPFLQDTTASGMKGSPSSTGTADTPVDPTPKPFADHEQIINNHRTHAETALQELVVGTTAEQVVALCSFMQSFLASLVEYLVAHIKHLRKQVHVQEKIIERKDELLQRFTHHRQEKAKRQNPARFRECSVRPLL